MTSEERQQKLNAAREAHKFLKYYLVHTTREPLEAPILHLLEGFELLDTTASETERRLSAALGLERQRREELETVIDNSTVGIDNR